MPVNMKHTVLSKRKDILSKVYINNHFNQTKVNFYESSKDTFVNLKSVSEVLEKINITEEEYKSALQILDDQDFQLHLKCRTDSCFVNNYFDIGLLAWEANINIQPVFNYYKATYMCSYLSKEEDECSQAMKQAFKETLEKGASYYEQMKIIAHAYSSKREPLSYSAKLLEAGVINVINKNKSLAEPFSDMVDEAFLHFRSDLTPCLDPFLHQENDDVNNKLLLREDIEDEQSDHIRSSDHHMLFQDMQPHQL